MIFVMCLCEKNTSTSVLNGHLMPPIADTFVFVHGGTEGY